MLKLHSAEYFKIEPKEAVFLLFYKVLQIFENKKLKQTQKLISTKFMICF